MRWIHRQRVRQPTPWDSAGEQLCTHNPSMLERESSSRCHPFAIWCSGPIFPSHPPAWICLFWPAVTKHNQYALLVCVAAHPHLLEGDNWSSEWCIGSGGHLGQQWPSLHWLYPLVRFTSLAGSAQSLTDSRCHHRASCGIQNTHTVPIQRRSPGIPWQARHVDLLARRADRVNSMGRQPVKRLGCESDASKSCSA